MENHDSISVMNLSLDVLSYLLILTKDTRIRLVNKYFYAAMILGIKRLLVEIGRELKIRPEFSCFRPKKMTLIRSINGKRLIEFCVQVDCDCVTELNSNYLKQKRPLEHCLE